MDLDLIYEKIKEINNNKALLNNYKLKISKLYNQYFQISFFDEKNNKSLPLSKLHLEIIKRNNIATLEMHFEQIKTEKYCNNKTIKNILKKHPEYECFKWWIKKDSNNKSIRYKNELNKLSIDDIIEKIKTSLEIFNNVVVEIYKQKNNKGETTMKTSPLNQILYGPPGTGKTYNTIKKALEIIAQTEDITLPEDRKELKKLFDEYRKKGQIEFITFHQSYGYEEFIEGIKPKVDDENKVFYKVENGVFKELSEKAKKNYENSKKDSETLNKEEEFYKKLEILKEKIQEQLEIKGKFIIGDTTTFIFDIDDNSFLYKGENWGNFQRMKFDDLKQLYFDKSMNRQDIKNNDIVSGLARQHASYFIKILHELYNTKIEKVSAKKEPLKNYILIIDEINRGNISKIFGELITLIEPSKRIGVEEEITITLPNSSENSGEFGVPQNLYIIGTMNTADRSIAQIDTALRRRFKFIEMMPDYEILNFEVDGIKIDEMLKAINERIEYYYDREHQIGHSYFIPLKTTSKEKQKDKLDEIFKNEIIPLLAEYFYDDWENIRKILNNDFIKLKETLDYVEKDNNKIYEIRNENSTSEPYQKIYEKKDKKVDK